jgi:flagellar motor component MotA
MTENTQKEVTTGADRLLDLIRGSKEISMENAAKKLGVPVQTIEAWATFLEEDNMVSIKYKFTTPYISPAVKKPKGYEGNDLDLPSGDLEISELKTEFTAAGDLLSKAANEKALGEFSLLKQTYAIIITRLKTIHDKIITESDISPQKRVFFKDSLRELDGLLESAADEVAGGKFDKSSASYLNIHNKIEELIKELNQVYEHVLTLQSVHETKDYKDILEKAYELMRAGNVEEAKSLYERLGFVHENLAKEFVEKKSQLENDLVKFNKDLSINVNKANAKKLKKLTDHIKVLLNTGNNLLKKNEFSNAESYYFSIKKEYQTLPNGFANEKKELQRKILTFYSSLAKQREKSMRRKFDESSSQINDFINETKELVKNNRVIEGMKVYKQIKEKYSELPLGFLKEKAKLEGKILPLYTSLMSTYTRESLEKLETRTKEIKSLISAMKGHIGRGEFEEAKNTYVQVKELHNQLPKGFLHEETELQNEIVNTYEDYLEKARNKETSGFDSTLVSITELIEESEKNLKKGNDGNVSRAYNEAMKQYKTLPTGFLNQRKEVRERLLKIYRYLLSKTNLPNLEAPAKPLEPESESIETDSSNEEILIETDVEGAKPFKHPKKPTEEINMESRTPEAIDNEIMDIEKKINELKLSSKAKVKMPV